ncbi:MAG: TetR/AcrR family transcriptional regulator [Candidatus Binatia bacterium]|nr:TetR/AcrR family transcriptional regulator [Candidatus Binatia bacterium]
MRVRLVKKESSGSGARAEARARTRERLFAVARRVFAEKGLAATNLRTDILEPSGVSVGSFYHQFRDKTELFLAILAEHEESFRKLLRAVHALAARRPAQEVAWQSFAAVLDMVEEHEDLLRMMARERESHDVRVRAYLRRNDRAWIESLAEDYLRNNLIPSKNHVLASRMAELVLTFTWGAVLRYSSWTPEERQRRRVDWIDDLVAFCLGGMAALLGQAHTYESEPQSDIEEV